MTVRLDTWLKVARVFKTRTQAGRACTTGRVRVNGRAAKSHRLLQLEDRVEVSDGDWTRILIIKKLRDKPVPRAEARTLYEDLSPARPKRDPKDILSVVLREKGAGRPTKKERRDIQRLKQDR